MPIPLYSKTETQVTGTVITYKKVASLGGYNLTDPPSLYFNEALVTINPDGTETVQDGVGIVNVPYVQGETFEILDANGNSAGIMSVDQLYQGLACLYLHKAIERDSAISNNQTTV